MKSSSAVATTVARRTRVPPGRGSAARNQHGPAGASEAVAPGDQIHEAPEREGGCGAGSAPIQRACQSASDNVVSHQRASLQRDARPAPSQTRTRQR